MKKAIETENLLLLACDKETLEVAIKGNEELEKYLNVTVPDNWTEFGVGPLQYSIDKLTSNESKQGWWTYFPIHKTDNKLIGSGGYKGKPTDKGIVELGYEISPDYRNKGLATEMTSALIYNAFSFSQVTAIIAHTLGQVNTSTKILTKCGFEEINDPDDGMIWKWELKRPTD